MEALIERINLVFVIAMLSVDTGLVYRTVEGRWKESRDEKIVVGRSPRDYNLLVTMAACNLRLEACHSVVRSCQGLWLSLRCPSFFFSFFLLPSSFSFAFSSSFWNPRNLYRERTTAQLRRERESERERNADTHVDRADR